MKNKFKSIIFIILIFSLVGCGNNNNANNANAQKAEEKKPDTKIITDVTGKKSRNTYKY